MPLTSVIKLLSDQPGLREKIQSFCTSEQDNDCEVVLIHTLEQTSENEVLLIAEDKIHLLLSLHARERLPCPIVFLRYSSKPLSQELKIHSHVDEVIDMNKITPAGFFRAISHAIDQFYIRNELYKQKSVLRELALELPDTISDATISGESSAKNLIKANQQLIETIRKQNEELKALARIDRLTKIGNRLNFEETLTAMIAHAHRHNHMLGLLMVDLDKFKNVNDTYGHQIGDQLLQEATKRLQNVLRKDDFIARLGGDEFAIVLNEIKSPHSAGVVSWKIIQEINKPFEINDIIISVDASVGIACYPLIGDSFEDLVKSADVAMYQAKKSHTLKYSFASINAQSDYLKKIKLEDELRSAIARNELTMVYQPIYEIPSKRLHGFEALIRWDNKILGKISPAEFIPIAEDTGLIHEISEWVLQTVCKQIAEWKISDRYPYKISINISPSQLVEKNLVDLVRDIIQTNQISLKLIEFEITEVSAIQENQLASTTIQQLCELGASHALDDFGTGYSSIQHLRYLPVSTIKIDQSFVQGLGTRSTDERIVSSIISLAKRMGLKVVAEGVETEQQLNTLIREGCDYIQGFLFSKPLTADQANELMDKCICDEKKENP